MKTRARVALSEARRATSFRRVDAFARSRLATLAQEMSSRKPTAPSNAHKVFCVCLAN